MIRVIPASVARACRRVAVPLTAYYAVTLGLPLANGAAASGARFVDHAFVVIVVPLLMVACSAILPWRRL
jgi:hypothetical protein